MKKILVIALLVLGVELQAQTAFMTSGRLFNFPTTEKGHLLNVKECSEIAQLCIDGNVNRNKWYTLSSGLKVQILHPSEWLTLVLESYRAIDNNITEGNLVEAINASEETTLNSNTPKTKNYYWSAKGGVDYIDNYNGNGEAIPIIAYKGCSTIKRSCGNPQIIKEKPKQNTNTSSVVYVHDTVYVEVPSQPNNVSDNSGHRFGEDGMNVVTVTPGGYNYQQPIGGWDNYEGNTNTYTQGGYNYQQPLSRSKNSTNVTPGGHTKSHPLHGGKNVITHTP